MDNAGSQIIALGGMMEYSLQGYCDIGVSYGLGDKVFKKSSLGDKIFEKSSDATVPNILKIGIRNPLGFGTVYRVHENNPRLIDLWREKASLMLDKKEMELGYDDSTRNSSEGIAAYQSFKQEIRDLINSHPIKLCHLTIYAIGVVFLRLDFASGIPNRLLQGFAHCFEYAAYLEPVSTALLQAARSAAEDALESSTRKRRRWGWWGRRDVGVGIQSLSKRPDPEIQEDEEGYTESRLFTGFTHVLMCIDRDDDVETLKRAIQPLKNGTDEHDSKTVVFEYHGKLHFNWAACVLEPKSPDDPDESSEEQIQRMLLCIQIAHSFHGACDAFQKLFFDETIEQADGYIKGVPGGRNHIELNRLRTLALAVVGLTSFAPVVVADEDQAYFKLYNEHAKLYELHKLILERGEILLNVQQAEADEEQTRRELFLNTVALFLAGFALLSVLADSYSFIKDQGELLSIDLTRLEVLSIIVFTILIVLFLLRRRILRKRGGRGYSR